MERCSACGRIQAGSFLSVSSPGVLVALVAFQSSKRSALLLEAREDAHRHLLLCISSTVCCVTDPACTINTRIILPNQVLHSI